MSNCERCIDPPRYVERVAPRELFHHQQKPRTSVDDGISDQRLMALHHIGDIAQFAHVAGLVLERNLGKVVGGDDGQHMSEHRVFNSAYQSIPRFLA